jgi:phosphoribosyl-AMP cyclohydrolase / phosphoribosyl-ATP pyrophosphohydrolase
MEINFSKYTDELVPAIVQDDQTNKVLMLGFMSREALAQTQKLGRVTFYSRTKKRLWTKGEESGHFLMLKEILVDCDQDSLLIKASPMGAVCHTGADTCWAEKNEVEGSGFVSRLEAIIRDRKNHPEENSYISGLFKKGINKIAQKVGEEAVELVIEAKDRNDYLFLNEAADLLFHYLILLEARGHNFREVTDVLQVRHDNKTA